MRRQRPGHADIGGGPALAVKRQLPILYLLGERLVAPWAKLPAGRKDPSLASGAAGQLHQVDRLVQHSTGLLGIALQDQGRRDVPEDHRLVLLLARTESPRGLLERDLGTLRIAQVEVTGADKPAELPSVEDPGHGVVGCRLRQVDIGAIQGELGVALLTKQRVRFRRKG